MKLENVDIIDTLGKIVDINTVNWKTDFNYDKKELLQSKNNDLLFISRKDGTHLYTEKETHIKDTDANFTFSYYKDSPTERVLAYAVRITQRTDEKLIGNIYELDYQAYLENVKVFSQPLDSVCLEIDGELKTIPFDKVDFAKLARFRIDHYISKDDQSIDRYLEGQKILRDMYVKNIDPETFFKKLEDSRTTEKVSNDLKKVVKDYNNNDKSIQRTGGQYER